jgi:ABC-type uncharacterized transport system substrate-binding protein
LSYGTEESDEQRRYGEILAGVWPPQRRFKLVLNLKTAKALGIILPQTLIVSADEVIGA